MNSARRALIGQGQGEFVEVEIRAYEQSYEELLCKGMDENRKTKLIMQKRKIAILENIKHVFMGTPVIFLPVLSPSVQPAD